MKKLTLALIALSAASQAFAASGGTQTLGLSYLTSGSLDQTPYEKMEALFNRAAPMQLGQFLTPTDPAIKHWNCVGAFKYTTIAELTQTNKVPARVVGTLVVPASPGTPSKGPLFPGTPPTQEQDQTITDIWLVTNDGRSNPSPKEVANAHTDNQVEITTSPGVVESALSYPDDASSRFTVTYRTIDGLIVSKQESANDDVMKSNYDFFYCYQK